MTLQKSPAYDEEATPANFLQRDLHTTMRRLHQGTCQKSPIHTSAKTALFNIYTSAKRALRILLPKSPMSLPTDSYDPIKEPCIRRGGNSRQFSARHQPKKPHPYVCKESYTHKRALQTTKRQLPPIPCKEFANKSPICTLIERNPPPRGVLLFTMCPDQEPCQRDFTTRCDGRISSWNLLHTALDQGT